jgi:hypothetical protein
MIYSHLGKKRHAHAPQSFLTLCVCVHETKNFCFPSLNRNDLFTLGKKNNDMLTPWSFLTLCVCVRETKNFFPSLNRNDLFTLGKKTTCSRHGHF